LKEEALSYSFHVSGATKAEVFEKVAAELDKVVESQPIHEFDRDTHERTVSAMLDLVEEPRRKVRHNVQRRRFLLPLRRDREIERCELERKPRNRAEITREDEMRALILVAAVALLAACNDDKVSNYPTDNTAAGNGTETTYKNCPDGSVVRSEEPCPKDGGQTKQP
jgi:hypothetical protein